MSSHNITKEELGLSVKILHNRSLRSWAHTIINPNTGRPISHSAIYSAINDKTPPWLLKKIINTVREAKRKAPKAFKEGATVIARQAEQTLPSN